MSTVFLDTVGLLAQWDQTDQWHETASQAIKELFQRGERTVTTSFILLECGNAAARRPYRPLVTQMRDALQSAGRLIVPTQQDLDLAWAAYAAGEIGEAGIVDQVSFTVMRPLRITDVFTNDRHFKAAGFNILF